jgi:hypothetical protein
MRRPTVATEKPSEEAAGTVAKSADAEPAPAGRKYDPNKRVRVMDVLTKQVVRRSVPESWLDGRFPNLKEVPSTKKAGK